MGRYIALPRRYIWLQKKCCFSRGSTRQSHDIVKQLVVLFDASPEHRRLPLELLNVLLTNAFDSVVDWFRKSIFSFSLKTYNFRWVSVTWWEVDCFFFFFFFFCLFCFVLFFCMPCTWVWWWETNTAGCKSTYHRWQVPPGGAPVVSDGENAAGCKLLTTDKIRFTSDNLPLINNGGNGIYYRWQLYNRCVWTAVGGKALLCFFALISFCTVSPWYLQTHQGS